MRKFCLALVMMSAAVLAACGSHQSARNGAVRILNAVPDGPLLILRVDGTINLQNVDFRNGTPFVAMGAGQYHLEVQQVLPAAATPTPTPTIVDLPSQTLATNDELTIAVVGKVADGSLESVLITNKTVGVPAGKTQFQFLHAATGVPPVDVYMSAPLVAPATPCDDLTGTAPVEAALDFKHFSQQTQRISGGVVICITAAGDPSTVLFDSGTLFLGSPGSSVLPAEGDILFGIVGYVGPGSADHLLSLSIMSGISGFVLNDQHAPAIPASLRVVHASPDTGPVNVELNDAAGAPITGGPMIPPGLAFGAVDPGPAAYRDVPPATYTVTFLDNADPTVTVVSSVQALTAGGSFTDLLAGLKAIPSVSRFAYADAVRRVATEGRLRLIDASTAAGAVDIYVLAHGADITQATANLAAVGLGSDTGYLQLIAGDYDIVLTATGSKTDIRYQRTITVETGKVYVGIALDAPGGGLPVSLLALDDLPP